MSSSPSFQEPWPAHTIDAVDLPSPPLPSPSSPPLHPRALKRRKIREIYDIQPAVGSSSNYARQLVTDQAEVANAKTQCQLTSGNDVISCFPTRNTVIPQHEWATFVWNSRRPDLTQLNLVDVYLFRGDSLQQLLHFRNLVNPQFQAGSITARVNDTWFGSDGANWEGRNVSFPFYWVITRSDHQLDGSELPQATFSAVQTTFADSVAVAMASSSSAAAAAASSASAASASSAASALSVTMSNSASGTNGATPTSSGAGSLQQGSGDSSFPKWAIAVIVILGFLAIAATCILVFLIIRRMRRRNSEYGSNRNSMGSGSPMLQHTGNNPQSPLLATGVVRQASSVGHGQRPPSIISPDGASEVSRANSAGDQVPFSGADAAIMAQAFRTALRKPDFTDRPVEEGDSPEQEDEPHRVALTRELAEEGRDIRSVSSSRGVKVETLSDQEGTIQDHR